MIKLQHINISYNDNIVYNDASFKANNGELTIISGKSGTGKSTLIDTLLCLHDCDYYYNDQPIDKDNQYDYLYQNVGLVTQIPSFFDDLKVKDHISLILDMYHIKEYDNELIELLSIQDTLHKYPKQLSGGERKRVSIMLSIIKDPSVLLLDEPTASLDKDNKYIVIEFLKKYAHQGHNVIVSTHDHELISQADVLYKIENKKLNEYNINHHIIENKETKHYKVNQNCFIKYILKSKIHQKFYHKFMFVFISLSIALLVIALNFNNAYMQFTKEQLEKLSTNEIIVYKNPFKDKSYLYDAQNPMEENDYKVIGQIKGVGSVEWRFDANIETDNDLYLMKKNNDNKMMMTSYKNNKKIKDYELDEYTQYNQYSYIDGKDYSKSLKYQFNNEDGVYITENLYLSLFGNEYDQGARQVEFMMVIPIYNASGIATVYSDSDESLTAPGNDITCQYVKVKLNVKGVVNAGSSLGAESSDDGIYVSQKTILKYYNKYIHDYPQKRTIYWISKEDKTYINKLPDGYKVTGEDQVVKQTRWTTSSCSAYTVVVDDLQYLDDIVNELKEQGYNVQNEYLNVQSYVSMQNNSKNIYIIASVVLLVVLGLFYVYIKYLDQIDNIQADHFLKTLGLNNKYRNDYSMISWLCSMIMVFILSSILFYIIKLTLETYNITVIKPNISLFIIILGLSLIIELIIPFVLKKVMKDD